MASLQWLTLVRLSLKFFLAYLYILISFVDLLTDIVSTQRTFCSSPNNGSSSSETNGDTSIGSLVMLARLIFRSQCTQHATLANVRLRPALKTGSVVKWVAVGIPYS